MSPIGCGRKWHRCCFRFSAACEPMGEGWMKAAEIFNVKGLATLVTGAASGIGLAYSEVMAANGARVAMLDKDDAALASAVAQLRGAGYDVHGATLDVTDR